MESKNGILELGRFVFPFTSIIDSIVQLQNAKTLWFFSCFDFFDIVANYFFRNCKVMR